MTEMTIRTYPDPVLRRTAAPVHHVDEAFIARANLMLEFMYEADGVGLAGNQVGWLERIVAIDSEQAHEGDRVFLNPRITHREGEAQGEEGCLSLPGIHIVVTRTARVTVTAWTLRGVKVELHAEGLAAAAWQHEIDHLDGKMIIDHAPESARTVLGRQLKQLEKDAED
jgi:peptide deformylase